MNEQELIEMIKRNKGTIIGIIVGIVLCILWFTIGFWSSVLIFSIIFICAFIGNRVSKYGLSGIVRIIDKILK